MGVTSMTGFGRGEAAGHGVKVAVELSSVNRRQFDCHVTLPRELSALEANLHTLVHGAVRRGQVKGTVQVSAARRAGQGGGLTLDMAAAAAQLDVLRRAARKLRLVDDLSASLLLTLPDVAHFASHPGDPLDLWPVVRAATTRAVERLHAMRAREGRALERDLTRRFARLRALRGRIARRAARVPALYRETLARRLARAAGETQADPALLARELALFADRADVSEELTRLASHLDQAALLMSGDEPCGRPLDFLCQELFREINTVGSKANDGALATLVIAFKAELEAIREQAQNVE